MTRLARRHSRLDLSDAAHYFGRTFLGLRLIHQIRAPIVELTARSRGGIVHLLSPDPGDSGAETR